MQANFYKSIARVIIIFTIQVSHKTDVAIYVIFTTSATKI